MYFFFLVAQGSVLQFPSVTKDHAGAYLCIASNEIPPRRSKRFLLTVLCKFKIFLLPINYSLDFT